MCKLIDDFSGFVDTWQAQSCEGARIGKRENSIIYSGTVPLSWSINPLIGHKWIIIICYCCRNNWINKLFNLWKKSSDNLSPLDIQLWINWIIIPPPNFHIFPTQKSVRLYLLRYVDLTLWNKCGCTSLLVMNYILLHIFWVATCFVNIQSQCHCGTKHNIFQSCLTFQNHKFFLWDSSDVMVW